MTVFSCLVKGETWNPNLVKKPVHDFTKKNPSNPAPTFNDGIIPTVRYSLCVMMQKRAPNKALTTSPLIVIWSFHSGTRSNSTPPPSMFFLSRINGSDISVPMISGTGRLFGTLFRGFTVFRKRFRSFRVWIRCGRRMSWKFVGKSNQWEELAVASSYGKVHVSQIKNEFKSLFVWFWVTYTYGSFRDRI